MVISQDICEGSIIPTARAGTLSPDDFAELKIDTRNFKFDREGAKFEWDEDTRNVSAFSVKNR
jgi:hypothetical protein